jgi:hypothetical protein
MGLMDIVNGKDEPNEREMDEGSVNLAKMVCLMVGNKSQDMKWGTCPFFFLIRI